MGALLSMEATFEMANQEDEEEESRHCAERAGRHWFAGVAMSYGSLEANRNKHCVDKGGHSDPGRWKEVLVGKTFFALGNAQ